MKYIPFASLASTRYAKTLKAARLTAVLGIVGLYVTLAIAAIFYWSQLGTLSASMSVNQILTTGVVASFTLIGSSCLMALIIIFNRESKTQY